MRRLGIVLAIALGAVLLSGSPRAQAASYSVTMANYAFSPAGLSVRAGDKVTWTNTDTAPHDATTTSAPVAFHSPRLEKGQSWSYTFTTPGTYSYICSIHPDMHATVVVAAAPATHPATHAATHPPAHAPAPSTAGAPTEAAPSMQMPAGPGGTGSASSRATPSARHASHPAPTRSSARASGPAAPAVAPPASVVPAVAAASTTTSLNPLLLVAGLVAAVATLCLLLLASRPGG